jgi:hypothetical protein
MAKSSLLIAFLITLAVSLHFNHLPHLADANQKLIDKFHEEMNQVRRSLSARV